MPQLTVYKASAGSGKTWRLTVEYLKLLVANPESYRSILAVTFTNKATAEMKERVLNALYELMHIDSTATPEGMTEAVCKELDISPALAKSRATQAIGFLLHDYGRFRIETIDSFFQSVLRNLARELGLGAWLNIELNNDAVLSDAVDALIDKAGSNSELLGWMTDYMEEQLQEGKTWKIDGVLKKFGHTIFKEYFKEKEKALNAKLSNKGFLKAYKKQLKEVEKVGLAALQEASSTFFNILDNNVLLIEDFSRGKTGPCSYFLKLMNGDCSDGIINSYVRAGLDDPANWSTKTSKLKSQITSLAAGKLNPLLVETESLRKKLYPQILSARMAGKHLNQVGLLTDIAAEVREQNRENNRFLLSDTNALLKSLLDGADASFVYEKTGTELNHILFDEFQDTSRMQWDTFKPLLAEGLANGHDSLIVGDEKQSIYRWRNGDWRILGSIAQEMRPAPVVENKLESNWRSERNIIDFNNALFTNLELELNRTHQETFGAASTELTNAYSDVVQQSGKEVVDGLVDISFINAKNDSLYKPMVLEKMIQKVEELQRNGVHPDQIAILIRANKFIPEIGEYFAEYKASAKSDPNLCYDIVSDEAFLLRSSRSIQILIDALSLLNDPANPIPQALLKLDYLSDVQAVTNELHPIFMQNEKSKSNKNNTAYKKTYIDSNPENQVLPSAFVTRFETLQRLPLYELVEELYRLFELEKIPAQDSYLHCFMDKLSEYLLHSPSDLGSFLKHWDEQMSGISIPAGSAVNGIRILSIHKSKGLEFHTVIIPFCDWKLLSSMNFQVWCPPTVEPFNQLDLLPIDYKTEMGQSIFSAEYAEETLQLWVDALNLLYVAFTRAKQNLYVFCRGNDELKNYSKPSTIANLMQDSLRSGIGLGTYSEAKNISTQNEEETLSEATYLYGAFSLKIEKETEKPTSVLREKGIDLSLPFRSFAHKTRFRQSNRSREFCKGRDPNGFTTTFIDRGKLLHRLFSDIKQKEDVPNALQTLLNEGLLKQEEVKEYELYVQRALSHEEVKDWYTGSYRLFNECSILCLNSDGKLQLKRPDRVMLKDNQVQVVDFKFGKPSPSYHKQVQEYMSLLTEMGYANVCGYLWYVDDNQVVTV
ncbi:MAG TPA: UvrD-helicase domain-containing protein [Bacteroidales bacterium]|nr:UvrD-helicase domain-containing protein [Bacteroidales bacterium]